MNIFVLSQSPEKAAAYHCDQHIHKMILEGAQLLSTAALKMLPPQSHKYFYKPTHQNHPCTLWLQESVSNCYWLIDLCIELEGIRFSLNHPSHVSMDIIKCFRDYAFGLPVETSTPFTFAGPAFIKLDNLRYPTISSKYQAYYRYKHRQWLDKGRGMSYKGRPVPDFMKDIIV